MDHHAKAGIEVDKDAVLELMSKHAMWLVEEAKRYVDIQSWKDFASSQVVNVDEEWDAEMDDLGYGHSALPIPSSPIPLSPKRKRVRPCSTITTLPTQ